MLSRVRDAIENSHLNFLIGSGLSSPYLNTLGQIETLLTQLEEANLQDNEKKIIRCSLYKTYFDGVIRKNRQVLAGDPATEPVLRGYLEFLKTINSILLQRKSTILGKEVNLFTTNVDIFLEKALETLGLECNDGFTGRFQPHFALSNFQKSHFRKSPQYDNLSELPTFNLLKLHGSLTWRLDAAKGMVFSTDLADIGKVEGITVTPSIVLEIADGTGLETLISGCAGMVSDASVETFLGAYDDLLIVNPTKAKFKQTILNQTHYELLRIYSNQLEKENSILFVLGFSFADEHIREITIRAANSNPTLMIIVIAYDSQSAANLKAKLPSTDLMNSNVEIVSPEMKANGEDEFKFNLETINKRILRQVVPE